MPLVDMLTTSSFLVAIVAVVFVQYYKGSDTKANLSTEQRKKSAVLVTGASRGIGKVIAEHLCFIGYTVFAGCRSQKSYDELLKSNEDSSDHKKTKGKIIPIMIDVTNEKQIQEAVKVCQSSLTKSNLEFVGIVNNAGINPEGDAYTKAIIEKSQQQNKEDGDTTGGGPENVLADEDTVMSTLNTNVGGCFRVTKAFLPLLNTDRGRIVLVGSFFGTIAGALGLAHLAYECSKFALEGLADGLRRGIQKDEDYGKIHVSLIKPGMIQTDMNQLAGESPPVVVSNDVLIALEAKRPSARYYPGSVKGLPCKFVCDFFEYFPTWLTDSQL